MWALPFLATAAAAAAAARRARRRGRCAAPRPLLGGGAAAAPPRTAADDEAGSWPSLIAQVAAVAIPNVGTFVLQLVNEQTNVIFLGRTGSNAALAAAGLGGTMQNCIGISTGWGLLAAFDTLVSQSHSSGQQQLACSHFQRGRVIATLQLLWIAPILFATEGILTAIGQDQTVSHLAAAYNRASAPALFCLFQFQATAKYLQNRCAAVPPMLINLCCSCLHVGWCKLFIGQLGLGNAGAGYANAVTWTCQWLLISLYLYAAAGRLGLPRRALLGLQPECLTGWWQYLSVAVPCLLQVSSEWWFWEILDLVVGYLGTVSLAAHVASLQVVALVFMPAIGIASAAAALVGNALGAGSPRRAKRLAGLCLGLNLVIWFAAASGMLLRRVQIASLYVRSEEVSQVMQALLSIFAFVGFADTTQNVMAGILRGMGRTALASTVYIFAYYGLMLPLGCFLAFNAGYGVQGLWYATGVGTCVAVLIFSAALWRTRFAAVAEKITKSG